MSITMVMGCPSSGKGTIVKNRFPNHLHINRDNEGGKVTSLLPLMESNITKDIVIDNTHGTIESRAPFIALAHKHGLEIDCVWLDTKIEDAQINALHRMWDRYGEVFFTSDDIKNHPEAKKDPNMFPPAALFSYRKRFEKPTVEEGFSNVEKVKFKRKALSSEYKNKAVIFDYDGTLRQTISGDKYPVSPDDVQVSDNIKKKLKSLDGLLLGVSNQSGVGKGVLTEADAIACFEETNKQCGIKIEYHFCAHTVPPIKCYCRKPQSGFGVYLIEKYKLDPTQCIMVGDMTSDKTWATRLGIEYVDQADYFGV